VLQLVRAPGNVLPPLILILALAHCGGSDLVLPASNTPPGAAFRIEPTAGDQQSGVVGTMLSLPLAVKVTDDSGGPVEGVTVHWSAANGGTVSTAVSTTSSDGLARVLRTLGSTPGSYATQAETAGLSGSPVLFRATAVAPGELPPNAMDDEYDTDEGHTNTLSVEEGDGVLQNDSDPEAEPLTASDATDPPNGEVTLNADGSFTYNPEVNFFGDDIFTYTARDPHGKKGTATVTIHVAPVNDSPRFIGGGNPPVLDGHAGPQRFESWATGIDAGAENETEQILEFQVVSNSNPALFTPDGQPAVTRNDPQSSEGVLTFTPSGVQGIATVTVVLTDNGGTAKGGVDTSGPYTFAILIF
jgi:hypothetical protein